MTARRILGGGHGAIIAATLVAAVVTTRASDWSQLGLLAALILLGVGSSLLAVHVRGALLSGSFSAMVIAMGLLGPAPAMVVGLATIAVTAIRSRPPLRYVGSNLATFCVFPLVGGLLFRAWPVADGVDDFTAVGIVVAVFMITNVLNFVLIYGYMVIADGRSWVRGVREMFVPVLPAQLAMALLTAGVFMISKHAGDNAVVLLAAVVLVFQWLLRTALAAYERGEQLEERNRELAALQVGLISTMLKTLSLRDRMTARHSAAVARYSRAMAEALALDEAEVELIHTAALFHDIGKFIFPDSILLADRKLTDEEFHIVRRHPVVGADLIGEIDGYGPVAEIVRHHHERIDGRGYPDAIPGEQIPLGSRMIAVADVYDVITARDTYRKPVSVGEAFAELRRSAGSQLDAELVELFIGLVEREGVMFRHSTAADFEAELALEHRVRDYAAPKVAA